MKSQLESLANEVLVDIFRYFYSDELFSIFAPLNERFESLIFSMKNFVFFSNRIEQKKFIKFCQSFSIVDENEDFVENLNEIQRLRLNYATESFIESLKKNRCENLRVFLADRHVSPLFMDEIRRMIFSEHFQRLEFVYLSRVVRPNVEFSWTKNFSLKVVRANELDAFSFPSILEASPNLVELHWKISLDSRSKKPIVVRHENLKTMKLQILYENFPWNDELLQNYFASTPKLENFKLIRSINEKDRNSQFFKRYDWFSKVLRENCFFIQKFRFCFKISTQNKFIDSKLILDEFSGRFHRNFSKFHRAQLQIAF